MIDPMSDWNAVARAAMSAMPRVCISAEAKAAGNVTDDDYSRLVLRVRERFAARTGCGEALFTTDADVWKTYLAVLVKESARAGEQRMTQEYSNQIGAARSALGATATESLVDVVDRVGYTLGRRGKGAHGETVGDAAKRVFAEAAAARGVRGLLADLAEATTLLNKELSK
jgi:hypothetical protein